MSTKQWSTSSRLLITAILAGVAAGIALYLSWVAWGKQGTPWGCGPDTGCDLVFQSRWSQIAGLPVGLPAALAYLILAGLALRHRRETESKWRVTAIVALCTAILGVTVWMIGLQRWAIGGYCPWCLVDHLLGMIACATALKAVGISPGPLPISRLPAGTLLGLAVAGGFVGLQFLTTSSSSPAIVNARMIQPPVDPSHGLTVTLTQGTVTMDRTACPVTGSSEAPKQLLVLFDYCCPHCRETHHVLHEKLQDAADQWQILWLPAPLNSDCNRMVIETDDRFREACELARLSLAVWKLAPDKWADFDHWLFESERPRSRKDARVKAETLCPPDQLKLTLQTGTLDQIIAANIELQVASNSPVLPVILRPGQTGISGRTETPEELERLLKNQLGFPVPPEMTKPLSD